MRRLGTMGSAAVPTMRDKEATEVQTDTIALTVTAP